MEKKAEQELFDLTSGTHHAPEKRKKYVHPSEEKVATIEGPDSKEYVSKDELTLWMKELKEEIEDNIEQARSWDGSEEEVQEHLSSMEHYKAMHEDLVRRGFIYKG